jgi:outer membrane protein assembly factor BamB
MTSHLSLHSILRFLAFAAALSCGVGQTRAEESWGEFRGPTGQGHSLRGSVPVEWSETKNVRWKTAIPGTGHSSPVILGDRIWMTTAITKMFSPAEKAERLKGNSLAKDLNLAKEVSLQAICVDRNTGKQLHAIELFNAKTPFPIHSLNSYASPTPVLEKGRLYCHFGALGTVALDTDTLKPIWKREFKIDHSVGPGASPVVWKNLVIVQCDGIDKQYVVAIDKATGKTVWKTTRSGELHANPEMKKAFCTPTIVEQGKVPLMISQGANWVYGYDVRDGREIWRASYGQLGFSTVPRPVVGHGLAFVCTSFMPSRLLAVRIDGEGDVSKSAVAWHFDKQVSSKPSVLLIGDELYMVSDSGIGTCLDAKTGKIHWRARLGGNYSASPLFASGRIYFSNQEGTTSVINLGTKFEKIATNKLDGRHMASPAVVGNAIYLRTDSALYRIEK